MDGGVDRGESYPGEGPPHREVRSGWRPHLALLGFLSYTRMTMAHVLSIQSSSSIAFGYYAQQS